MPILRRLCPGCRVALITPPVRRCPSCTRRDQQRRDAKRGTTSARGLGFAYQRKRQRILARDRHVCWICGRPGADSVDHVVPRARGGDDSDTNLRAAHSTCNASRGAGT